jgi:hypothetical protein
VKCRLCGSSATSILALGGLSYTDCRVCGYIGLAVRHFPSRESELARYALHRNDPSEGGYRRYLSRFVDGAVVPFAGPGARILDFGSGPEPALALILRDRGYDCSVYDPFFAPALSWRRRLWDLIAVHEVAEHLRAPGRTLRSLAGKLEAGGALACRSRFPPAAAGALESWWYRFDTTHLGFFRPETWAFLAEACGLVIALLAEPDTVVMRRPRGLLRGGASRRRVV